MTYRILRAFILAGLAALTLLTHVFVDIEQVRAKVVQTPTAATAGLVRVTIDAGSSANQLQPPFALIARINSHAAGSSAFSIDVDGAPVCKSDVNGDGSRRVDCAVAGAWNPGVAHDVSIHGPSTAWTLDYLELATHHGSTAGFHRLLVLPAASDHYVGLARRWVLAAGLLLAAALLLLPTPSLPRGIRLAYYAVAGVIVLELAVSQSSQWISPYRIILSADTFTRWMVLLLVPRLWTTGRLVMQKAAAALAAQPAARRTVESIAAVVLVLVGGAAAWQIFLNDPWNDALNRRKQMELSKATELPRIHLLAELQPVKLANCEFKRFGEPNDGGYLLCANLLADVQSGYSYGVSGYDQWGCDISTGLSVPVHQYDCFNLTRPVCPTGRTVFHEECIGDRLATIDGRLFDNLGNQFAKNGDGAKRVVIKMDVEGAEWDTLLQAPDAVLQQISQLTIEMHGVGEAEKYTTVVKKLKQFFYVANVHFNNFACLEGIQPFPSEAYEVLFVNKRLAVPGGSGPGGAPAGMMTPNNPKWKDCQSLADLPPVRPPS